MKGIILIGASTGAPRSHHLYLQHWPASLKMPIVIVQHMPPGPFLDGMSRYLRHFVPRLECVSENTKLCPGCVYLIEPGHHARFSPSGEMLMQPANKENFFSPSIDITFASAAEVYRSNAVAIMVSGLHADHDGIAGCRAIRQSGGRVIVASEETLECGNMVKQVKMVGEYDMEVPLDSVLEAAQNKSAVSA